MVDVSEGKQEHVESLCRQKNVLGPKLLLVMGCVKLGEKNCVQLPSVGEQNAN